MTTLKLDSKTARAAADGVEQWIAQLYASPGIRKVGVIEIAHVERTQPAPDADKEPSVKVRITHLELARPEQEEALRQAMRALYVQRTAQGTLDDEGVLQLSDSTLESTAGLLGGIETARLTAAVRHWAGVARRVLDTPDATAMELRHELDTIADGLAAVLRPGEDQP